MSSKRVNRIGIIHSIITIFIIIVLFLVMGGCATPQQIHHSMNTNNLIGIEFNSSIEHLQRANISTPIDHWDGPYNLTTIPIIQNIHGIDVRMWAFNGQIPGPFLRVKKGSNQIIRFTNNLDIETTIHWHGIRLDNKYDGVPGITQQPILPGESYIYNLTFPDEGMFWYHPHNREDYLQESGLYGVILVESNKKIPATQEEVLVLDDILMDANKIMPFYTNFISRTLMGRFGNVFLVNGKETYELNVTKGDIVRFYLLNAANARPFNMSFGSKIKVIGSDGGYYEQEFFSDTVILAPSERATVDVLYDTIGIYPITHTTPTNHIILGRVIVHEETKSTDLSKEFYTLHNRTESRINQLKKYATLPPNITIRLDAEIQGMSNMISRPEEIEWEDSPMNAITTNNSMQWSMIDASTKKSEPHYIWKQGEVIKIQITNPITGVHTMNHPIHFHGQRFLVISRDGKQQENLVWKDSVLIKGGETIQILLDLTNPGVWMAHCHIAEHLGAGMMMHFTVK